jgi:hypothetical protein
VGRQCVLKQSSVTDRRIEIEFEALRARSGEKRVPTVVTLSGLDHTKHEQLGKVWIELQLLENV